MLPFPTFTIAVQRNHRFFSFPFQYLSIHTHLHIQPSYLHTHIYIHTLIMPSSLLHSFTSFSSQHTWRHPLGEKLIHTPTQFQWLWKIKTCYHSSSSSFWVIGSMFKLPLLTLSSHNSLASTPSSHPTTIQGTFLSHIEI